MNIAAIILSSALISAVTSIILGYVFEHTRYLKDKKLTVYTEFLEQLDKVFPYELFESIDGHTLISIMQRENARLGKHILKIKLLSQNKNIRRNADELSSLFDDLIDRIDPDASQEETDAITEKVRTISEELIGEMNNDIRSLF